MTRKTPENTMYVPPFGQIDFSEVKPIVDTKPFQLLRRRSQLGFVAGVYPCSTHTRFVHSLGVYKLAKKITTSLRERGMLTEKEAKHTQVAGLVHDLGHGPFSHLIEPLLKRYNSGYENHKDRTRHLLETEEMQDAIKEVGCSPDFVKSIVEKIHHLGQIISNKTIGADKVGYINQDIYFTGHPSSAVNFDAVIPFLMYVGDVYGAAERVGCHIQNMQNSFLEMYTGPYFRKQTKAKGRAFEKSMALALDSGIVFPNVVWEMTDAQLEVALQNSNCQEILTLLERSEFYSDEQYKTAIIIKLDDYTESEKDKGKSKSVVGTTKEKLKQMLDYCENPIKRTVLEMKLAKLLNIKELDLIITTYPEFANVIPEDLTFFDDHGVYKGKLFSLYKKHAESLQEKADNYLALHVMVTQPLREGVAEHAKVVAKQLEDLINNPQHTEV